MNYYDNMTLSMPLPQCLAMISQSLQLQASGYVIPDAVAICRALGLNYPGLMASGGLIGVTLTSARALGMEHLVVAHRGYAMDWYQPEIPNEEEELYWADESDDDYLPRTEKPNISRRDSTKNQQKWYKQINAEKATIQCILSLFQNEGMAFNARNLATTAHRIARLHKPGSRLRDKRMLALADACRQRVAEMDAQGMTYTVWAYATLRICVPRLFAAVAGVATALLDTFSPASIATLAWAYAVAQYRAPRLFTGIADKVTPNVTKYTSQELANLAWCMAVANHKAPRLCTAIAKSLTDKVDTFDEEMLMSLIWAIGSAQTDAPLFFSGVEAILLPDIHTKKIKQIADLVWAFAKSRAYAPRLFQAVVDSMITRKKKISITDDSTARMLWAFAYASFDAAAPLFTLVAQQYTHIHKNTLTTQVSAQALTYTIWAFVSIDFDLRTHTDLVYILLQTLMKKDKLKELQPTELSLLHMVRLHLDLILPERKNPLSPISDKLKESYKANDLNIAFHLQRDISTALDRIGWQHKTDFITPKEALFIDMHQSKYAIEVSAPSAFLYSGKQRHTLHGARKFKLRILRKLGWHLIQIPYFEWAALRKFPKNEEAYLRHKLGRLLNCNEKEPLTETQASRIAASTLNKSDHKKIDILRHNRQLPPPPPSSSVTSSPPSSVVAAPEVNAVTEDEEAEDDDKL